MNDKLEQALQAECAVRICIYHWNRVRQRVPAQHVIAGEGMCGSCFSGRSFRAKHEQGGAGRRLTDAKVAEIRAKLSQGAKGQDLASEYGVSDRLISIVKNRRGAYR